MRSPNKGSVSSAVKIVFISIMIFLLVAPRRAPSVNAVGGSDNWAIGAYYGSIGSSATDIGVDAYVAGLPTDHQCDESFAVFTASIDGYVPQISIENVAGCNDTGTYLYDVLLTTSYVFEFNYTHTVSGLLANWHDIELKLTKVQVGSVYYDTLDWILDGTTYDTYTITSCTVPCSLPDFDNEAVPNIAVESADPYNANFSSLDVHGYFQSPIGTSQGGMYLYPANWGQTTGDGNCPLPSGAQTTSFTIGRLYEAPSNADVTGHHYVGTWGAADEWAIGIGDTSGYASITDSDLSSTFCSSGPPQVS